MSGEDILNSQGAGDQGMMFGYACDETPDLMPMPIWLAHRLALQLSKVRKDGTLPWLRPDGKTQVSLDYVDAKPRRLRTVLISTQHAPEISQPEIAEALKEHVVTPLLPEGLDHEGFGWFCNPTGQVRPRRPARRHRTHRPQDHRRHLRRYGPARRRRLLRQGPVEGRPVGGVRGPVGRQARRGIGRCAAVRDPGGLRHRRRPPGLGDGGDVRDCDSRLRRRSRRRSRRCSTCGLLQFFVTSDCGRRSSSRPPRTGTSGGPSFRGRTSVASPTSSPPSVSNPLVTACPVSSGSSRT